MINKQVMEEVTEDKDVGEGEEDMDIEQDQENDIHGAPGTGNDAGTVDDWSRGDTATRQSVSADWAEDQTVQEDQTQDNMMVDGIEGGLTTSSGGKDSATAKKLKGKEAVKKKRQEGMAKEAAKRWELTKKREESKKRKVKEQKEKKKQREEEGEETGGSESNPLKTGHYTIPMDLSGTRDNPIYVDLLGHVSHAHAIPFILTSAAGHCTRYPERTQRQPSAGRCYFPYLLFTIDSPCSSQMKHSPFLHTLLTPTLSQ
jgi:hypothetical protein